MAHIRNSFLVLCSAFTAIGVYLPLKEVKLKTTTVELQESFIQAHGYQSYRKAYITAYGIHHKVNEAVKEAGTRFTTERRGHRSTSEDENVYDSSSHFNGQRGSHFGSNDGFYESDEGGPYVGQTEEVRDKNDNAYDIEVPPVGRVRSDFQSGEHIVRHISSGNQLFREAAAFSFESPITPEETAEDLLSDEEFCGLAEIVLFGGGQSSDAEDRYLECQEVAERDMLAYCRGRSF